MPPSRGEQAPGLSGRTREPHLLYALGNALGSGGMGAVYEAVGPRGETVAVKLAHRERRVAMSCLSNESSILRGLRHPNLVRHHLFVERDQGSMLVMELIRGETLEDWLDASCPASTTSNVYSEARSLASASVRPIQRRSALDRYGAQRVREVFQEMAAGIAALHDNGRLHCDLKPSNIMLDDDRRRVVIVDFGLARASSCTAPAGAVYGTIDYLAPECLRGAPHSTASDWFAFGLMLFEALTGQLPRDHLLRTCGSEAEPVQSLRRHAPSDLAELCSGLLHTDPKLRIDRRDVGRALGVRRSTSKPALPSHTSLASALLC